MPTKSKASSVQHGPLGKGGRQKKPKKEGPKKALTAYMLFSMARREQIVREKPELRSNVTEMSKIIGAEWRQMSPEDKLPYQREHELAKERYLVEKEKFDRQGSLAKDDTPVEDEDVHHSGGGDEDDEDEDEDEARDGDHQSFHDKTPETHHVRPREDHPVTSQESTLPVSTTHKDYGIPTKRQRQDSSSSIHKSSSETSLDPHHANPSISSPRRDTEEASSNEDDDEEQDQTSDHQDESD